MDQHWKSVMASVHNQRTSSSEKSGGMHRQILALFTTYISTYKLSQVWKHIRRYRINVTGWMIRLLFHLSTKWWNASAIHAG